MTTNGLGPPFKQMRAASPARWSATARDWSRVGRGACPGSTGLLASPNTFRCIVSFRSPSSITQNALEGWITRGRLVLGSGCPSESVRKHQNAGSQARPRLTESESLLVGPQSLSFNRLPGDSQETVFLFVNFLDFPVKIRILRKIQ